MSDFLLDPSSTSILQHANSNGSSETVWMCRLAWAFAGHLCDKYHNLVSWLIWLLEDFFFLLLDKNMPRYASKSSQQGNSNRNTHSLSCWGDSNENPKHVFMGEYGSLSLNYHLTDLDCNLPLGLPGCIICWTRNGLVAVCTGWGLTGPTTGVDANGNLPVKGMP